MFLSVHNIICECDVDKPGEIHMIVSLNLGKCVVGGSHSDMLSLIENLGDENPLC